MDLYLAKEKWPISSFMEGNKVQSAYALAPGPILFYLNLYYLIPLLYTDLNEIKMQLFYQRHS